MQIIEVMPATGRDLAERFGRWRNVHDDVQSGLRLLDWYLFEYRLSPLESR